MPKIRLNTGLRSRVNLMLSETIAGTTIRVPYVQGQRMRRAYEPWMTELLRGLFAHREGAFLDLGVNNGETLVKAKAVDPSRRYIGFEPNPSCAAYLNRLIKENAFSDCNVLPVGLWHEDAVLKFHFRYDAVDDPTASLFSHNENMGTIYAPCMTLETVRKAIDIGPVGVAKVDVEGAELEVIEQISPLLLETRAPLICEVLPPANEEAQHRTEKLTQVISTLGYDTLSVDMNSRPERPFLIECNGFSEESGAVSRDYVFVHPDDKATFIAEFDPPA